MLPQVLLSKSDEVLAKVIASIRPPIIDSTNDVFHDIMSCILEQQIHYRSSKKIFKSMLERAGISTLNHDNFQLFEENAFEGLKLSQSKHETVLAALTFFSENEINWDQLTDSEVAEKLSSIKGIGSWTIDMILMFTLKRPNIFPADDFQLKQIMANLYQLNEKVKLKAKMLEVAENWGENKSLAVLYLLDYKYYLKILKRI